MTRQLEETFNIAPIPDEVMIEPAQAMPEDAIAALHDAGDVLDKIDTALPRVRELDNSDNELDELSDLAKTTFNDLIELGMNVDPRFAGTIMQTAGVLLGHAITAKTAKVDRKMRTLDLQIKKAKLDLDIRTKTGSTESDPITGKVEAVDRNELLLTMMKELKKK